MKALIPLSREVIGLFVDDGMLATGIVITVVLAGVSEYLIPDAPILSGMILVFGCLGVLFMNVLKSGGS